MSQQNNILRGVFIPSQIPSIPSIRYIYNNLLFNMTVEYVNPEEKQFSDGINSIVRLKTGGNDDGIPCSLIYSTSLSNNIGKICTLELIISENLKITTKIRISSISIHQNN